MTRRRVLLLAVPSTAVALAVAAWLLWPRPSAITPENIDRITDGMALAEVEAILSGPARDEIGKTSQQIEPDGTRRWVANGCAVSMTFDQQMRVRRNTIEC